MGKNIAQDNATGTLKKNSAIGKKTINAKANWAKLNKTVASGNTSIGRATFLIKFPLSTIEPVDIVSACAKKLQGKIPIMMKYAKFCGPPRRIWPKT